MQRLQFLQKTYLSYFTEDRPGEVQFQSTADLTIRKFIIRFLLSFNTPSLFKIYISSLNKNILIQQG